MGGTEKKGNHVEMQFNSGSCKMREMPYIPALLDRSTQEMSFYFFPLLFAALQTPGQHTAWAYSSDIIYQRVHALHYWEKECSLGKTKN